VDRQEPRLQGRHRNGIAEPAQQPGVQVGRRAGGPPQFRDHRFAGFERPFPHCAAIGEGYRHSYLARAPEGHHHEAAEGHFGTLGGTKIEAFVDRDIERARKVADGLGGGRDGKAGDMFGQAGDISGNSLLIGSPKSDAKGLDAGAAYVFTWNGGAYLEQKRLYPIDAQDGDHFGSAVAMNIETAIVGAPDADVFGPNSGSAYAFFREGTLWSQQKKFIAATGDAGDGFGWSVDIDKDTAVIGSPMADAAANDAGAAFIFQRTGISWNPAGALAPIGLAADDRFGSSVSISGSAIAVGAFLDDTADINAGPG